jgi:hypothetical protein
MYGFENPLPVGFKLVAILSIMVGYVWCRHSDITNACFEIGFVVLILQWLWITFALVHTKVWNRMSRDKLHKLVYVNYNLRLRLKDAVGFTSVQGEEDRVRDKASAMWGHCRGKRCGSSWSTVATTGRGGGCHADAATSSLTIKRHGSSHFKRKIG